MIEAADLHIIESFLKLRLKAACLDAIAKDSPKQPIPGPKLVSVPLSSSVLYEPFHQLLDLSFDKSGEKPKCWNVIYTYRGPEWEVVSFSTSKGCVVRVELHKRPPPNGPETIFVYTEPILPLCQSQFPLYRILDMFKFISDVIYPLIEEDLRESRIPPPANSEIK
uniref:START domain-containing protein n=1 Tax=Mesocestoides corti TaxID=53468 RepID=A0A5K3F7C3_MESCO